MTERPAPRPPGATGTAVDGLSVGIASREMNRISCVIDDQGMH